MAEPAPSKAAARRHWIVAIVAIVLLAAAYATGRVLGHVHWREVFAHIAATPAHTLLLAVSLTAGSYLVLTLFDRLAVLAVGARLRWRSTMLTSFQAFAVGHNIGLAALSGGSIRLRWYTRAGLSPWQVTQVIAFCSFTSLLGAALLCGLSLAARAPLAGVVLHIGTFGARAIGALFIAFVCAYCVLAFLRREPLLLGRLRVPVLHPAIALGQVAVGSTDLLLAAGVLYVLLPASATHGFLAFLAVYLLSVAAGLASSLPGGIGVFETVLLQLLPDGPTDEKLAAMLTYRAIYYLLPFVCSLALLAAREAWVGRAALARGLAWVQAWVRLAVPQLISATVFLGGVLLLLSGATPAAHGRLRLLREVVPLPLVETSHLLGSAAGISLVLLAQGLQRRLDAAWHVTMWLLGIGIVASLTKGLDYEEALALCVVGLLLLASKDRFQRKASLLQQPFSTAWTIAVLAAVASSLCLAWLSYRDVNYSNEMWWRFAFRSDAPRTLRAEVLIVVITGIAAAWLLLRPARHEPDLPDEADLERARGIVAASCDTTAWLALLGDKNLLFSADGRGLVMYRPVGRNWIAMGDPVGPPEVRHELLWRFREACDRYAARPVFYQIAVEDLPAYIDAGFVLSKIGEEARVPLADFDLEGGRRADLRQTWRRVQRQEVYFEVLSAEQTARNIDALRAVSYAWLTGLSAAEKGFSLGRFEDHYIRNFPCAVVKRDDAILAFANLWCGADRGELSVDLMRYYPNAPKGVMDFLLVELMLWGRQQGFGWFNLGMAPLAGLADREFAPLWNRVGAFLFHHGERFYNFEGLRAYKEKFLPEWRPRYLATSGRLGIARTVMDVAGLIAGSSRRIVMP
ncbi:MAG TPA: bifunctional lysylphosphatidylglycerol flippase/synthetase MprF [Steroidobacteraceae bacterium]|nr:bifunctional lysylphosphatidylglycerol flippase/synthetase MprF [Steroidobacteraceae bacterium]